MYRMYSDIPPSQTFPLFEHSTLCVEDFNSHHSQSSSVKEVITTSTVVWSKNNKLFSVFDAKDASNIHSACCWRHGYSAVSRLVFQFFSSKQQRDNFLCAFPYAQFCFNRDSCDYEADWVALFARLGMVLFFNIHPLLVIVSLFSSCQP